MKQIKTIILTLLTAPIAHASISEVQTASYLTAEIIASETNVTNSSGSIPIISHQFNPFSGNPDDLISFTIAWDITYSFSGQLDNSGGGNASFSASGTYYANSLSYDGNGSGSGNSGDAGELIEFDATIAKSTTYLASEANVTYSPVLLAIMLGSDPINLSWGDGQLGNYTLNGSFDTFNFQIDPGSSVSLTYEIVPEPATAPLLASLLAWGYVTIVRRRK